MGQKVHPVGFRVGITKPYQSQWFARFHKYQYSQTILEDRLLRQTLMTLFPTLLNPFLKKIKKREDNTTLSPRITHIKIERGLIPYQIGIQIHAENCELIKSAIDNLTVNKELLSNLQKTRRYLLLLKMKPGVSSSVSEVRSPQDLSKGSSTELSTSQEIKKEEYQKKRIPRNKNTLEKRLRKRQEIKKFLMVLQKKTSRFSVTVQRQGVRTSMSMGFISDSLEKFSSNRGKYGNIKQRNSISGQKKQSYRNQVNKSIGSSSCNSLIRNIATASPNKTKRLAFDIFLNKTQKKFLKHLKEQMRYWNNQMKKREEVILKSAKNSSDLLYPVGYNKNWSLVNEDNSWTPQNKSISKLTKLVRIIEKKSLIKMDRLRYDFVSSGPLSKAQTFGYYQIINFLKSLKEYIKKQRSIQAKNINATPAVKKTLIAWDEKAIQQRLSNIEEECRKIKFIEYLKGIIQKHRQENIYFYLSTIADSKKNLRKIQQFTKRHSNILFGIDLSSGINSFDQSKVDNTVVLNNIQSEQSSAQGPTGLRVMRTQIRRSLQQPSELQTIFLKQIEKQKKINQENCKLTQKISLKFYSAATSVLETKATIVAETIVDALEKRQAFRKVIKQAMAKTMKNTRVKGIKIQVAGRLNGAEIARTEWARSGRVPLQTLTANIDYSYKTANTIYGIIGIKVWIFKGYTTVI